MINVLDKRLEEISKAKDIIITILVIIGALLVPTFLAKLLPPGSNVQIVIGSIVNTSLILTSMYLKGKVKITAICTLPSTSTILGGILFNSANIYSKYMIPFIWIGNFIFIYLFKKLFVERKKNYLFTALISIISKVSIIYLGFSVMAFLSNPPEKIYNILSTSMGITQLITASIASAIVYFIIKIKKSRA